MTMHPHDTHPAPDALHDLVDDRLSPADRVAVETHLGTCDACARQVARLRALLATAAALPRELDPARDGWPALRATLAERTSEAAAHREASVVVPARRNAWLRATLAAAAVLLVAVTGWRALRPDATARELTITTTSDMTGLARGDSLPFAAVERDYARAAAELTAQLDATRDRLSPSAAASVDRSLATIDGALAEARAALRADPGNPDVARFVTASYEQKLDLLRRSTAITSGD